MAESSPLDPLDVLRTARDSMRKLQDLAGKLSVPAGQRRALAEGLARMTMPGEQLQAMVDLADAFGPPHAQIETIQTTLAEQRELLETMLEDLGRVEAGVDRLVEASEQIATMQAPFRSMLERFQASEQRRNARDGADEFDEFDEEA